MTEELKRCPFCGGKVTHKCGENEIPETVFCYTCNIAIPTDVWQSRANEEGDMIKRRYLEDKIFRNF